MKSRILIYGVDTYIGGLTSRLAAHNGLAHIGAGGNIAPVAQHATALERGKNAAPGMVEPRIFPLRAARRIAEQLDDAAVLVNAAPLKGDALACLLEACLATGTHYLDVASSRAHVAALIAEHEAAERARVLLMAGAGFDFAAVDAVAARLAHILPGARALTLVVKRGVLAGAEVGPLIAAIRTPGETIKNGQIVPARAGERILEMDLGAGPETAWLAPWRGEAMAARHRGPYSTMESYEVLPERLARALTPGTMSNRFFKRGWGLKRLERKVAAGGKAPTAEQLKRGRGIVWGEARSPDGAIHRARLETPHPHIYSAEAIIVLARAALEGTAKPGFQLPSVVGGAALVEGIAGVTWREIADVADDAANEIAGGTENVVPQTATS